MKKIILFLISFIVSNPSFSQLFGETFNTKEIVKQNKIRTETGYLLFSLSDSSLLYIRNYDPQGNLISSKSFSFKGRPFLMDTLIYDINFQCIKKIQMDKNGIPEIDYIYTYDKQGNQTLIEAYKNDTLLHSQKKLYNENNQNITDSSKYYKGNFFESGKFVYDKNGLKIKAIINLSPDSTYTTTYKYNKKKILIERHLTKPNADVITTYSYNSSNQCVEEKRTTKQKGNKTKSFIKFSYLSNGLLSRKEEYKNDKAPKVSTFQYVYYE